MIINRLIARNWRNFQQIDVPLRGRQFVVGPNASGSEKAEMLTSDKKHLNLTDLPME